MYQLHTNKLVLNAKNRFLHAATIGTVLLMVAVCYHSALSFSPIWDDIYATIASYYLRDNTWHIAFAESYINPNYYRPLPVWTRAYESFHVGIQGVGYSGHLINLVVHVCSTALVMLLVSNVSPSSTNNRWLIVPLSGLFFGLHPAALPIPAWISARFDLMLVFFILLALCADIFIRDIRWRCASIATAFLGAALSKETAVVFPLLLLPWHWLLIQTGMRENNWHLWRNHTYRNIYASIFAAGLLYLLIRYLGLGYLVQAEVIQSINIPNKSIAQHAWLIIETLGLYFRLLFVPFGAIQPSFVQGPEFSPLNLHAIFGIIILLTTILFVLIRRTRAIGLALAILITAMLPVLNIIPTPIKDSFADLRFSYIIIALCSLTLTPLILHNAFRHKSLKLIAISLLLGWIGLAYWNIQRVLPAWKNDINFWSWYIESHSDTLLGRENLATAYNTAGQHAQAMPIANEYLHRTSSAKAHVLRGYTLLKLARYPEAETEFLAAIPMVKEVGEWSKVLIYIAEAQLNQSKLDDVPALIEQSLQLEPGNGNANIIKLKYGLHQKDARIVRDAYMQLRSNYAEKPALLDDVLHKAGINYADIAVHLPQDSAGKSR